MTHIATARGRRGKGLRSKAARRRKHDLAHQTHTPKHDHTPDPRSNA